MGGGEDCGVGVFGVGGVGERGGGCGGDGGEVYVGGGWGVDF